jgi:hypothetical protein
MPQTWLPERIWRCGRLDFNRDEILQAPEVCTADELAGIAGHGFTGIWFRGRLTNLMRSAVLPELNDAQRDSRVEAMTAVIARGRAAGLGTWLYFNEPLAPLETHRVFQAHPEIVGRTHLDRGGDRNHTVTAICTSTPKGLAFFREAVQSVLQALPGLAGIILITASEFPTHCWSKVKRDPAARGSAVNPGCPHCAAREPADVVGDLVSAWTDAAAACPAPPRVVAWNWSWSMWYPEPQQEVIDRLPAGVDLLIDYERGDERPWRDRSISVDEYSLGYVGPSRRFRLTAESAQRRGMGVFAKLQIDTTHEIASVPNLPVIGNLHAKFTGLAKAQAAGMLGCWNFGCDLTLNTYAARLFARDPERYADRDAFFADLAGEYLGIGDAAPLAAAWDAYARALLLYPFCIPMLYTAPVNYAPAYPLTLTGEGRRFGPSWLHHQPWGDDPASCIGPFTLAEVTDALRELAGQWRAATPAYVQALAQGSHRDRCAAEAGVAQMIGLQWQSAANVFAWLQWRGPRRDALDEAAHAILDDERATLTAALPLVDADPRLGYHQEAQHRWYDGASIRAKLAGLAALQGR